VEYGFRLVFAFHRSSDREGAIKVSLRHNVREKRPVWALAVEELHDLQRLPTIADNGVIPDDAVFKYKSTFVGHKLAGIETTVLERISIYVNPLVPEVLICLLIQGGRKESR